MDLRLTDEQDQLVASLVSLYEKHASPERVRAAEPLGHDKELWDRLLDLGLISMAVDEAAGGFGASFLDLVLAAEQQGRAIAPAPAIEAQVAARLLAGVGSDAIDAVLAGDRLVTFALWPAANGRATAVPAAAVADDAVVLDGDRLLLVPLKGTRQPFENLGSMPLADIDLNVAGAEVLASGKAALAAHDAAVDDWLRLMAAALVGIGGRALEVGVHYVKERKAWGVPIGSFQAVSHRLADSATALDGARILNYEAAWAVTADSDRASELASMAFAFASEASNDATYRSLHFHGGYGFMMEYDIQLFWRRARAWGGVWGDPALAYRRAADRRYGAS